MRVPLFVCHANCCRSVLAHYLYESLGRGARSLSAGVEAGDELNDRAAAMLRRWGIDASSHRPRQLDRSLCDGSDAILVMSPKHLARILAEYGRDLASKSYLFADPYTMPVGFLNGEYHVYDPSFENRPIGDLTADFHWFHDRVLEIFLTLNQGGRAFVPASRYLNLLETLPA
jgi:low molecular weight protein-tyrosine phosphatase